MVYPIFLRNVNVGEGMQMSNFAEKVLRINVAYLLLAYLLLCTMIV